MMEVTFLVAFWQITLGKPILEIKSLVSYFLISQSISLIVMARRTEFGTELRRMVKYGLINMYLVRPMHIIPYLYSSALGNQGLSLILSVILLIVGIMINPPTSYLNILSFCLFLPIAMGISFAFNLLEGVFAFYVTETGPLAGSIRRIIEVFSGAIAPLYFFPQNITKILELSPFPSMVYGPVNSLNNGLNFMQVWVGLFWLVVLNIIVLLLWQNAIKRYEAIGM